MSSARVFDLLERFVVPLIIGAFSAYVLVTNSVVRLDEKINRLDDKIAVVDKHISSLDNTVEVVRQNQIEIATRGEWMRMVESNLKVLNDEMTQIRGTRYTDRDAQRDQKLLLNELQKIKGVVESNAKIISGGAND